MPKFSAYVALMSPEFRPVTFAPGDDVPEWALDQVGPHVIKGAKAEPEPEPASVVANPKPDEDTDDPDSEPEAPDFTQPKRRGRPAKK